MSKKRYLILGAGGQLGSEWVKQLMLRDADFVATDYPETDITKPEHIHLKFRDHQFDVVVNCAAYTAVDKAEDEPEISDKINFHAVQSLAEICKKEQAILIHYSTDYVFSGKAGDENRYPDGYTEDAPINPVNAYGLSKWKGEDAIRSVGCNHQILRISWLCGPIGNNFMKTMIRLGKERDELNVVNDQIGSPTFTSDVVDANLRLLELEAEGTFHVTCQGKMSWYDFAVKTLEKAGVNVKINPITSDQFPMKAPRPYFSKLNTNKFETITNGITYSVDAGIEHFLDEISS